MENEKISEEVFWQLISSQFDKSKAPKYILLLPYLFDDLRILEKLFKSEIPTWFPICFKVAAEIIYSFADVSGGGLGSIT